MSGLFYSPAFKVAIAATLVPWRAVKDVYLDCSSVMRGVDFDVGFMDQDS
jgi:hypothetical protein